MSRIRQYLAALPVCVCLAMTSVGSTIEESPTVQEVNTALQEEDYAKMESLCRAILREDPGNAQGWFLLGYALHAQGEIDEAILAHITATGFAETAPLAYYNLGCAQAIKGNADQAFKALEQAVELGINNPQQYKTDSDLQSLRADARWKALMGSIQARSSASTSAGSSASVKGSANAERTPETALHFWVGSWDCYSAKSGKLAGRNILAFRVNNRVIHERWEAAGGSSMGESWNHYDPIAKAWKQTWVGSGGDVIEFVADTSSDASGVMFVGHSYDPSAGGEPPLHRMHVREIGDGRVRQTGTESTDDGVTWVVKYDLIYVPRGEGFDLEDLGV